MTNRTDPPPEQPTPITDDLHATPAALLARAAVDYRQAQARRQQLDREDRVHGQETR